MRMVPTLLLMLPLVLALATQADARPKKPLNTKEDPTISNGIAVFRQAGSQPKDYWCNAGDYARRKFRAGSGSALELVRPMGAPGGPSDRQSVGFSLVSGKGDSGTVSVERVGEGHSIGQTKAYCAGQVDPRNI